jgi:hypothetical protein
MGTSQRGAEETVEVANDNSNATKGSVCSIRCAGFGDGAEVGP